jgi:hypothetical protein
VTREATDVFSQPHGGTRLGVVDSGDPFQRVQWVHPDRLTEDMRDVTVRCNCASTAPTLGTERSEHLPTCPLSALPQPHKATDKQQVGDGQ